MAKKRTPEQIELGRILELMAETDPTDEKYAVYSRRAKELCEIIATEEGIINEKKRVKNEAAGKVGDIAAKIGLGLLQTGLILVGFCFESGDSLSGFYTKSVQPKLNFFNNR